MPLTRCQTIDFLKRWRFASKLVECPQKTTFCQISRQIFWASVKEVLLVLSNMVKNGSERWTVGYNLFTLLVPQPVPMESFGKTTYVSIVLFLDTLG